MGKKNNDFLEIERLKERHKLLITEQELKIKYSLKELGNDLSGATLLNKAREGLFSGSGLAFKLGFIAIALLRKRRIRNSRK